MGAYLRMWVDLPLFCALPFTDWSTVQMKLNTALCTLVFHCWSSQGVGWCIGLVWMPVYEKYEGFWECMVGVIIREGIGICRSGMIEGGGTERAMVPAPQLKAALAGAVSLPAPLLPSPRAPCSFLPPPSQCALSLIRTYTRAYPYLTHWIYLRGILAHNVRKLFRISHTMPSLNDWSMRISLLLSLIYSAEPVLSDHCFQIEYFYL